MMRNKNSLSQVDQRLTKDLSTVEATLQEACEQSVAGVRDEHGNKLQELEQLYKDKLTDLEYQIELLNTKSDENEEKRKLASVKSEHIEKMTNSLKKLEEDNKVLIEKLKDDLTQKEQLYMRMFNELGIDPEDQEALIAELQEEAKDKVADGIAAATHSSNKAGSPEVQKEKSFRRKVSSGLKGSLHGGSNEILTDPQLKQVEKLVEERISRFALSSKLEREKEEEEKKKKKAGPKANIKRKHSIQYEDDVDGIELHKRADKKFKQNQSDLKGEKAMAN